MLNPNEFAKWLNSMVGQGYIMGTVGQYTKDISESSWYITQYSGSQLTQAKKWLKTVDRVFDCQGLSDCYVTEQTGKKTNVYARNNYANWCDPKGEGTIPAKYRMPGAAVFMHSTSAGHITHVGYLVEPINADKPEGDWWVVEARGVMYGVVKTKLSARSWNRWGLMTKYFEYDGYKPITYELGERTLRQGMTGADVKALQADLITLGYSCGSYGADGDFGSATYAAVRTFQQKNGLDVDGIAGPATIGKLASLLAETGDPQEESTEPDLPAVQPYDEHGYEVTGGSVWIWNGHPDAGGEKVVIVHQGDVLAPLKEGVYVPIVHNGTVKWINQKYIKEA